MTRPDETRTTFVESTVQFAKAVTSYELPSEETVVAANCSLDPEERTLDAGEMTSVAGLTPDAPPTLPASISPPFAPPKPPLVVVVVPPAVDPAATMIIAGPVVPLPVTTEPPVGPPLVLVAAFPLESTDPDPVDVSVLLD